MAGSAPAQIAITHHAKQRAVERLGTGADDWLVQEALALWTAGHATRKLPAWASKLATGARSRRRDRDDARYLRTHHPEHGVPVVIVVLHDEKRNRLVIVTVITRRNSTERRGTADERRHDRFSRRDRTRRPIREDQR